jgi:UDP-N-acetylglucosamine 2-epimerase (non-hydrolysing)
MNNTKGTVYFFIGTEAELIKIFPVILELKKKNLLTKIIASGQNDITRSKLLDFCDSKIDILINANPIQKTPIALIKWFVKTRSLAKKALQNEFKNINKEKTIFVVHGDTITTVMGSQLAKSMGIKVAHVEAGLRSGDFLNPFPEELDRYLTSFFSDIHFVPEKTALANLKKAKGEVVDTVANTIVDSCRYTINYKCNEKTVKSLKGEKYFVLVLHRQENLLNKKFVEEVIKSAEELSKSLKCVLILHEPSLAAFERYELLDKIRENRRIIAINRLFYLDFMKLLDGSEFVLTDGGSNQPELFYLGKPTMLLRKKTEQEIGINKNIILYGNDLKNVKKFAKNYKKFAKKPLQESISPSLIIAKKIEEYLNGK